MKSLDLKKIRSLAAPQRYNELYYYFREAEQMLASSFPQAQRHGRLLKRQVEELYEEWFGSPALNVAGCIYPGLTQTL
jgi:hypothetical protein